MLNVISCQGYINWKYHEIAVRLKFKGLRTPSGGEDVEQQEFLYIVSWSVKCYTYFGK